VSRIPLLLRAALTAAVLVAAPVGTWSLVRPPLTAVTTQVDGVGVEAALQAVCAAALLASVLWLAATAAVALLAGLGAALAPGSRPTTVLERVTERRCPRRVRRLVVLGLGVTLAAGGTAGPALAAGSPGPGAAPTSAAAALSGLPLPDRTTGVDLTATAATPSLRPVPARSSGRSGSVRPATVVVRPGDSLWALAAALLPAGADDAEITAAWHRLHRVNADVIGEDPDLIRPGTRLRVPHLTT